MISADWMHLDPGQRTAAMPVVAGLMTHFGRLFISLRHGPVPVGRRMFDVGLAETVALGQACGLDPILTREGDAALLGQSGVTWTRIAFEKG